MTARPNLHLIASPADRILAGMDERTFDPARRGYHVAYRPGETNHCPGCGRTHWYVGRQMAECAFCAAAVPLEGAVL